MDQFNLFSLHVHLVHDRGCIIQFYQYICDKDCSLSSSYKKKKRNGIKICTFASLFKHNSQKECRGKDCCLSCKIPGSWGMLSHAIIRHMPKVYYVSWHNVVSVSTKFARKITQHLKLFTIYFVFYFLQNTQN